MARDRSEYDEEQDEYERRNIYVPIDTFINKSMGHEYDPYEEYEEEEMIVPLEF